MQVIAETNQFSEKCDTHTNLSVPFCVCVCCIFLYPGLQNVQFFNIGQYSLIHIPEQNLHKFIIFVRQKDNHKNMEKHQ